MIDTQKNDAHQHDSFLFFKSLPLFADLLLEDIERFSSFSHVKNYKKGKVLFVEGENAEFFYIIINGWLRLFHTMEEGDEINLAIMTTNSSLGESAIFEHGNYTSSAQIVEDAQLLSIPLALLKEHLRESHQMAFNMLSIMAQYQRQNSLQLELYHFYNAPQRIGCFLLGLCPPPQQIDGVKIRLPYDKSLIASTLGMQGSTFSRALNILRKETGIQLKGTHVTIESIKKLLKFVDGCYLETLVKKVK